MRSKRTKKHHDTIAKKEGLRLGEVQEITESFFRFTAQVMSEGNRKLMDFSDVRIMKLGIFKVKEGRRKHFERLNKLHDVKKRSKES